MQVPCKNHPEGKTHIRFEDIQARGFKDEKSMLRVFAAMMRKRDPDVIAGWNLTQADIQQLTKRMTACGLDPRLMSPLNRIRYEYGGWAQPIPGRNCIDLMEAFVHLWTIRNGQLASKALGDVAQHCLGETKIQLENGHDTYFSDFGTYLDYAIRDVDLLPKLNAINNAIEHYTAIQHIVGCDIRTAPFITKIVTVLALRDEEFDRRIPTRPEFDAVPYTGAEVMEVEAGIHRNIGIMDIKAMYHSNVNLHNISWDTLDDEGDDCGNGVRFRKGDKGLLGRLMDKMTHLRNEYKARLKSASTDKERTRYDSLQNATKHLVASMYGAAGDSKYGLYHPQVAQAITFTSRETLFRLRDICNEMGLTVIYGHTDSVFCEIPDPQKGLNALRTINQRMSPIETEFEKWCESFVIVAKNRYAGMTAWTDGQFHEPSLYVKGIEMKQSRLPPAMKECMSIMLEGMLSGASEDEVVGALTSIVNDALSDMPLDDLCIRAKLEKDLSSYKVLGEARAGAAWANDVLGKGYRAGSRFLCALDENSKYIAFDNPQEIEGFATISRRGMAERFLVKKVRPYIEMVGWDCTPLDNALEGWTTGWL
jgi:DNA polymerase I